MRIACIYWYTSSVGGIATHLNSLRTAAIKAGDRFDILHSRNWKTKSPALFAKREWVRGGDTKIWIDGELPHGPNNVRASIRWLEANYDAICFGFICPHERKDYPTPDFLPLYETRLPKVAIVPDGYWEEYASWAEPLLPKLKGVLCPVESYADQIRKTGYDRICVSPQPFTPVVGSRLPKSESPLLIWPNQWKNIKGVNDFLGIVPRIPKEVEIELYSCGIRYYQLRTEQLWKEAVGEDRFQGHHGKGRAIYFGNVDLPEITQAYQRAWFTVNLQGMRSKKEAYKRGSYNFTEVEALYYGVCPILHSSTLQTPIPPETYIAVDSAEEIPEKIAEALESGFALCPERRRKAREFVLNRHLASKRYQDLKDLLTTERN